MGRKKKRMEQEKLPLGTIYQVKKGGNYYLRYQINGRRKNVNLKTNDYDKALEEYNRLLPTLQATTVEVVAAHVKNARQLAGRIMRLTLGGAWEKYSVSPDRAMPATVHEQQSYKRTWDDFVAFVGNSLTLVSQISYDTARDMRSTCRRTYRRRSIVTISDSAMRKNRHNSIQKARFSTCHTENSTPRKRHQTAPFSLPSGTKWHLFFKAPHHADSRRRDLVPLLCLMLHI